MVSKKDSSIEVRKSGIHGKGVFATQQISKGSKIIEYKGERISLKKANKRYEDRESTYLFMIEDNLYIDGLVRGNDARFINHSCKPNCEAYLEDGKVVIHAIKNIKPEDELLYDYQLYAEDADMEELRAHYPCKCGAKKCKGTMVGQHD